MKKLPDEQFELKETCGEPGCPIDNWFPRFRYLLHIKLDDSLGDKEAEKMAAKFGGILNDEQVFNPLVVVRACFLVAAQAWERFKENVEKGDYKAVVN